MIKKVKEIVQKIKQKRNQKKELKKMQEYYEVLQSGALFIRYVQQDIGKQKKNTMNRKTRRRFEKDLNKKGKLTPEIVEYYKGAVDQILENIKKEKEKR